MRITYRIQGGFAHFPGLAQPRTVDVEALPAQEGNELRTLAKAVKKQATKLKRAPVAPDQRTYVIVIDDGRRKQTITVADPVEDDATANLIAHLQRIAT